MDNIKPFSDVREIEGIMSNNEQIIAADRSTLESLTFNEKTVFSSDSKIIADGLLEKGKNPGLSIKKIHSEGITGKGVNIAIIDQPIVIHPEYEGKIIDYINLDEDSYEGESSMHGPAVLSLFCGQNIGVAPDSKVLYVAVPSWKCEFTYYEKAVDWIINKNKSFGENEKIKVVSLSAVPAYVGSFKNPDKYDYYSKKWNQILAKALGNDILIICCSQTMYNISAGYYDLNDPDNISAFTIGFPNSELKKRNVKQNTLIVPVAHRTVAEIYEEETPSYCYDGAGGESWGIPYLCGCLALAMQINHALSAQQLMDIVFDTAYKKNECFVLNPSDFIQSIKKNYSPITVDVNMIK